MKPGQREEALQRARDEDPLEPPYDDDDAIERCWGYEIPVRHGAPSRDGRRAR